MPFTERNPSKHLTFPASRLETPAASVNNLYRDLFDQAPIGYVVVCREGLILEANRAAIVLLGTLNESLIGRRLANSVVNDLIHQFEQLFVQARNSDGIVEGEFLFSRANGAPFWASVAIQRSYNIDDQARTSFLVTLKDVSREKAEEQLLTENIERFQHAIDATRDGIWDWDMPSGSVYFSPQWARLLGYDPGEVSQRVEFFFEMLHPDDVSLVKQALDDHLSGRMPVKQGEVRLRTKTGDYRWFLDRGQVVSRDSSGAPVRMVGTITDITKRKLAEAALRDSFEVAHFIMDS